MTKSNLNVRWGPLVDAVIMTGKKEEVRAQELKERQSLYMEELV